VYRRDEKRYVNVRGGAGIEARDEITMGEESEIALLVPVEGEALKEKRREPND
jgi:hypothetical protein